MILGLDSGGTKTVLAFADRTGTVTSLSLGRGLDPSADSNWPQSLEAMLEGHHAKLGLLEAAVLGMPFHDEVTSYSDQQSAVAKAFIPGRTLVQNDVRIAFDGALAGKPGVLVLAGTGSMAWSSLNGPDDPHIRVGGWGDAFGDEGSAFWIGREALACVSQHLDGRMSAPAFTDAILSSLKLRPDELIGWCYGLENRRVGFADLARLTSTLADVGDTDAIEILHRAADHLAAHITAAWRQTTTAMPVQWSYAGGVSNGAVVLQRIAVQVGCSPVPPRLPPIGGALLRAAANAGWSVDDGWIDHLSSSLSTQINA
jgi:glucosamine kinase